MFIHVYFALKLVVRGRDDPAHSREQRRLFSDLSCHIKERQKGIYCLNFLKEIDN